MKNISQLSNAAYDNFPRKKNGRTYLGTGVASVLVALIILVLACFAALTFISADSKAEMAKKSSDYCTDYYAAETVASNLLSSISEGKGNVSSKSGSKSTYDTDAGKIVVTKAERYVQFQVPINSKQVLDVEANVDKKNIRIINWSVE